MAHKGLAFARQQRALAAALKQPHRQHFFKFLESFGDGGLGDGQHAGGFLQAAVLRHRQKALQMPEFDALINHG